jgi:hypothetical protein
MNADANINHALTVHPTAGVHASRSRALIVMAAWMALGLLWATLLSGCGVGTSGTGTGGAIAVNAPPATSNAPVTTTTATVCTSSFTASLACSLTGTATTANGTASVTWTSAANDSSAGSVRALLSGNAIVLDAACTGLRFEGSWTERADGSAAFVGRFTTTANPSPVDAVLRVQVDASTTAFSVRVALQDLLGQPVVVDPPFWLLRPTTNAAPARCS